MTKKKLPTKKPRRLDTALHCGVKTLILAHKYIKLAPCTVHTECNSRCNSDIVCTVYCQARTNTYHGI